MSMNEPEDLFAVQSADQFKMDGNNNNRITGPPAAGGQFSFPASLAGYAASGAAVGHDVSLAQILYYQNLLKQQTNTTSKLQSRSSLPQYAVINNPTSILPQVPGSPTNRSFAAALRNLAKQIGPGPSTSPERDSSLSDTDSRQPSPKARVSSSLLRNSSPTQNSSKTNDKGKIANSNSETRSGFQPYRPEENRTSLSAQSTVPPPNPYGLDPTAAAAYSPYHAAAAAAAAAAAFYPPHLQHAYRLEEQLYLERCGVPMFPPSPYASHLYGMMPTALGLVSPAIHERLKLEEEQRQRESLERERERERSEREKREKSKKSPRASPSHSHLSDSPARKAPITVSPGLANHHTPPPPQPSPSLSSSSKHSQSSPTPSNQLPASNSVPFMRPFEDNYSSTSSPSAKSKNSFLSSLTDSISSPSALAAAGSYPNSVNPTTTPSTSPFAAMPATKLPNPFECFAAPKTPDGSLISDPPTAHLASSQTSSYLSNSAAIAAGISSTAELSSFPSVAASSVNSFKPFSSYPYDLIQQYPAFKNHLIAPAAAASSLSPPLPKKARSVASGETAASKETTGRTGKGRSAGGGKSRAKSSKAAEKKLSSTSSSSSTTSSSSSIVCDLNSTPLNLSTSVNCESVEKPNGVESTAAGNYDLNSDGVTPAVAASKEDTSAAYSVVTEVN